LVTSNDPIEKCFSKSQDVQAIKRRFGEVEMTEDNKLMIQSWVRDEARLQQGPQKQRRVGITVERRTHWRDEIEEAIRNGEIEDEREKRVDERKVKNGENEM
jgi:hypothetical protein